MAEKKYLYGAAVQAIQSYIFQTNQLQDIIGASELVAKICSELFEEAVGKSYKEGNKVIGAAGNIKYIFDSEEECKAVVKIFPKKVVEAAPGITISQAVVDFTDDKEYPSKVEELENKLRIQRNKAMKSTTIGCLGVLRSRNTGLPVVEINGGEYIDEATKKKRANTKGSESRLCKDAFGTEISHKEFAYDVEKMCDKNNWLAIIHADGNGLGQIVQEIGKDRNKFKRFSQKLDEATKAAAREAFKDIFPLEKWDKVIPIRPIVVGGDDFTVICRGSLAMDFVKAYLDHFEKETENMLKEIGVTKYTKLTACAGVAFIKSSYPFYYGYNLAETLCEEAKKEAKKPENMDGNIVRSCLMFHKVQDSFITNYAEIEKRELTPTKGWSYKYGPYYLKKYGDRIAIDELLEFSKTKLVGKEGNALKSGLRKWMTCLSAQGVEAAIQLKKRLEQITSNNNRGTLNSLISKYVETVSDGKTIKVLPVYDVLSLCSIINKETNK